MTSTSSQGNTSITLQFSLDRNIDAAAQDVQAAIAKTLRQLPDGILAALLPEGEPGRLADYLPGAHLRDHAALGISTNTPRSFLAQRISTVNGVAQVQVFGSQKYAVRVQLDPQALAARGIGIDEVAEAVSAGNVNLPTGILWGPHQRLDGAGQRAAAGRGGIPPADRRLPQRRAGAARRPRPGARRRAERQAPRAGSTAARAIVLAIQRQPGTNTVAGGGRRRSDLVAQFRHAAAASGQAGRAVRPLDLDPRIRSTTCSSRCC